MAGLLSYFKEGLIEAGCDEAGRGCLVGPVFAAAVILTKGLRMPLLNDSKKLSEAVRYKLREQIEAKALAWAVGVVTHEEIDRMNILNASFLAMHRAIEKLNVTPELLLIDGNNFNPYVDIKHVCIIKGDAKYRSIAAASILAKTYRDDFMMREHEKTPFYAWDKNKGYPSKEHRLAMIKYGKSNIHRKSFGIHPDQLELPF